jgi:hypothetical protein
MKKYAALRWELAVLVVVLVALVVMTISVPLGLRMAGIQRRALVSGFQDQATLLMDTLARSAENQFQLREEGFLGAEMMPRFHAAMPEATFATISGPDPVSSPALRPTDPKDFVWASDEKRFADERNVGMNFRIARETVDDEVARTVVGRLQEQIDGDATTGLSSLIERYQVLRARVRALLVSNEPSARTQRSAAFAQMKDVLDAIDSRAKEAYGKAASVPELDPDTSLAPAYLFYRPVIFYNRAPVGADASFYQGLIRLEVRTGRIQRQIDDSIRSTRRAVGTMALAALGLGVIGAVLFAFIVIRKGSVVEGEH